MRAPTSAEIALQEGRIDVHFGSNEHACASNGSGVPSTREPRVFLAIADSTAALNCILHATSAKIRVVHRGLTSTILALSTHAGVKRVSMGRLTDGPQLHLAQEKRETARPPARSASAPRTHPCGTGATPGTAPAVRSRQLLLSLVSDNVNLIRLVIAECHLRFQYTISNYF